MPSLGKFVTAANICAKVKSAVQFFARFHDLKALLRYSWDLGTAKITDHNLRLTQNSCYIYDVLRTAADAERKVLLNLELDSAKMLRHPRAAIKLGHGNTDPYPWPTRGFLS